MPDEQEVTSTINVETGSAESNVGNLDARLAKLEEAFLKLESSAKAGGGATETAGNAASGAAGKHQTLAEKITAAVAAQKEHALIAAGVAKELEGEQGALSRLTTAMEQHGRTLAMASDALGSNFGGSVSRVTAGLGALQNTFGASMGSIGLLGGAVAVVAIDFEVLSKAAGAAFQFLKESVAAASTWQQNLTLLGQTVKDQGASWDTLRGSVEQWADLQEQTTAFSRDEAVSALTELTATGMSLADAMKVVRVSEDAAAATGHSLTDVTHGLMEAEHGRTQALTALGIGTRQSIHDGMAFNDVLKAIEKQTGGAAISATDAYNDKLKQLQNEWHSLQADGNEVLPILSKIVDYVDDVVVALMHWQDAVGAVEKSVMSAFPGIAKEFQDIESHNFAAAIRDAASALNEVGQAVAHPLGALETAMGATVRGLHNEGAYIRSREVRANSNPNTNTDITTEVGGKLGSGASAADKAAREAAKALRDEISLDIQALDHKREAAGKDADAELKAVNVEIEALKKLEQTRGISAKQREEINGKLVTLENKEASIRAEVARKAEEAEKRKQEAEQKTYDQLARHLDAQVKIAEDTYGKDSTQYLAALQNEMKALAQWLATNKGANQQLVDDAKEKYAELFKAYNDEIAAEEKAADDHEKKLEEQYQKLQDAQQKWADKATSYIEQFFQKGKHGTQSFADAWKKMLDDMEQALLRSALSKLLLGVFRTGGGQFAGLGALFGEPQSQSSAAATNASQGGIVGAMLGPSGAASVASALPTSGGLFGMLFGSSAPAPTGGSGTGGQTNVITTIVGAGSGAPVTPGTLQSVYGMATGSQVGSLGGSAGGGVPGIGGIPWGNTVGGATLGSWAAAGAGGALVGQLVYGGRGFADLGGAVGGMAGLGIGLAAGLGPVGIIGAALVGALAGGGIGSMFNHDNPNEMPDKYATGSFGQGMADFSGAGHNGVPQFHANGQGFSENASLYTSLGSMGMGRYIGDYIASTGGTGLTPQEIDEFRGTHGNLVALHNGYLTIDNGKTIWWETLVADAHDAVSRIQGAGGAPVFNVSHSFPDFGGAGVTSAGNYFPTSPGGGSGGTPSPTPPAGSGGGGSMPISPPGSIRSSGFGGVTVQVNVGGTIIAQSDLVQAIEEIVGATMSTGPQRRMSMYSRSF